jgi:hypothetical protein
MSSAVERVRAGGSIAAVSRAMRVDSFNLGINALLVPFPFRLFKRRPFVVRSFVRFYYGDASTASDKGMASWLSHTARTLGKITLKSIAYNTKK